MKTIVNTMLTRKPMFFGMIHYIIRNTKYIF